MLSDVVLASAAKEGYPSINSYIKSKLLVYSFDKACFVKRKRMNRYDIDTIHV